MFYISAIVAAFDVSKNRMKVLEKDLWFPLFWNDIRSSAVFFRKIRSCGIWCRLVWLCYYAI